MSETVPPIEQRTATIEAVHRDIALANQYRLELIKLVMTISGAILAFTVSFRPSLRQVEYPWLMWMGWIGLAASMVGGMLHMHGWDRFYLSYRDYDWKGKKECGRQQRAHINRWRKASMFLQFAGFAIGVMAIALFAAVNIGNVTPTTIAKP
jgi:hypothetical protein